MMHDKLVAGLLAFVVIAPVCAVCLLGPAVLASVAAGIAGWFGGLDPAVVVGLAVLAGVATFGIVRRRMARHVQSGHEGETSR